MVPGQHGADEVVAAPSTRLAPVALPTRLRVVAPVADHRITAAAGAAHALAPAVLAHQREALGVVQQRREIDQVDCCHDGGGSSHEPVSYSHSRLEARPPSAPRPTSPPQKPMALVGFRGVGSASCDQGGDERAKQGFAATACVVHELEEPQIERQLLLRDPPVRAEPGAQQGPEPLDRVDVHLAEPVAILVAGVFAAPVADRFVLIPPGRQAGVDAILVGMDERAFGNRGRDDRLDRRLLHVGQHGQDYLTSALDQAENGWLVLLPRAPARRVGQPATAPEPPLLATAAGWPLWPATT